MVSVLLTFLVGVLDGDRKETAKSNAQEEIQAAMSYIADDVQEAVYIYGSEALATVNGQLPHMQATASDCNTGAGLTGATCTPVLVFWKRYTYNPSAIGTYSSGAGTDKIGCMPFKDVPSATPPGLNKTNCDASTTPFGGDRFTYSLVAYYLKRDTGSATWSNTARILRWELKDGYGWYCATGGSTTDTVNCPTTVAQTRLPTANSPKISIGGVPLADANNYFIVPSKGFNRPDFVSSGTLSSLAGAWLKFDDFDFSSTSSPFVTLVDFIDDTAYFTAPTAGTFSSDGNAVATGAGTTSTAAIKIPIGKNTPAGSIVGVASATNLDCDNPSIGVGNPSPASAANPTRAVTQRVPADFNDATSNPSGLSSFYICVAPESVTARIYIRGNAIARLTTPTIDRSSFARQPNANNLSFFPTANTRAFGRSAVGLNKK